MGLQPPTHGRNHQLAQINGWSSLLVVPPVMTKNLVKIDGGLLTQVSLKSTFSCLRPRRKRLIVSFLVFSLQTRTSHQFGMPTKLFCTIAPPTTIWVISVVIITSQSCGITNLEAKIMCWPWWSILFKCRVSALKAKMRQSSSVVLLLVLLELSHISTTSPTFWNHTMWKP
jgi:hypothetical protein